LQNASTALAMLDRLSQMGIHLAVGRLRTGSPASAISSVSPLNTLKIDASFIRDLSSDNNDAVIVQAIIALAHSLRLEWSPKVWSTTRQLGCLRSFGSDQYQGYLHSKPLPAAEFERLLGAARSSL
jgi:EAL domain-containing protein (putative c-di-GMP-specific phosphodiesterase class I)